MRDRAATDLCNAYPAGTEPYDRLGERLRLVVEPSPNRVVAGQIPDFTVQMRLDNAPLKMVDSWPTNNCDELQFEQIPQGGFVAAWCRHGPQTNHWDRISSDRIRARDVQTGATDFDLVTEADVGQTGDYKLKVVGTALVRLGANDVRVATRVLAFDLSLLSATQSRSDGWLISYELATQAIVEHVDSNGTITPVATIRIPYDILHPVKSVTQRRLVTLDATTGQAIIGTGDTVIFLETDGSSRFVDQLAGVSLQGLRGLSIDSSRHRLWLAFSQRVVAVDLLADAVVREQAINVKDIVADPATGGAWMFAAQSGTRRVLQRVAEQPNDDLVVHQVLDASAPIPRNPRACLDVTSSGEVVCNAIIDTNPALVKVNASGTIVAQATNADASVTQPVDLSIDAAGTVWTISDFGNRAGLTNYSADLQTAQRLPFRQISATGEIQQFWSVDANKTTGELWLAGNVQIRDPVSGENRPRRLVLLRDSNGSWRTLNGTTGRVAPFLRTF